MYHSSSLPLQVDSQRLALTEEKTLTQQRNAQIANLRLALESTGRAAADDERAAQVWEGQGCICQWGIMDLRPYPPYPLSPILLHPTLPHTPGPGARGQGQGGRDRAH